MTKFLSRYPDGAAGVALALMRFSCALNALSVLAHLPFLPSLLGVFAVIAVALSAGVGTRAIAFALAGAAAAAAFMTGGELAMIAHACGYLALALLGPGAYSIDAKLFGRRVIRLEPRSPDRGSGD